MESLETTIATTETEISLAELKSRMDRPGLVLLDVLAPEHYADGHIPSAINLPLAEIEQRATAVIPNRNAEVVVYCAGFT
ncbi:MAG TPA: rhodanese-like domain-containing protein [Candidatus Binataceae bacterium]|nr:rhodanese-like domain-containing protein [Candidatus Binataceae bacterium]